MREELTKVLSPVSEVPIIAVKYGSPRRHSNILKPLKKSEKTKIHFYDHFRTS